MPVVKSVFLLGCYRCIFHRTGNLAQLCQNFGISEGWFEPTKLHPLSTPLVLQGSMSTGSKEDESILGMFGLQDFTILQPVLGRRTSWNLWTVRFFNFKILSGLSDLRVTGTADTGAHLHVHSSRPLCFWAWKKRTRPCSYTLVQILSSASCSLYIHFFTYMIMIYSRTSIIWTSINRAFD
jgi:hypothetical protein